MFVSNASSVDIIIYLYFVVNMNKWQDRSTYCISPYRFVSSIRKVWIYQICVTRSRKSQDRQYNDLQNTTQKIEERATRTLIKTGGELKSSERVSSSCTVCDIRRVALVTNSVISHGWGNYRIVIWANGTYPWSFETQMFHNG